MFKWLLCAVFLSMSLPCAAVSEIVDYKKPISEKLEQIASASPEKKADLLKDLAILYYLDQEKEKAFLVYLQAIELAPVLINNQPNTDENIYQEALKTYLAQDNQSVQKKYTSIVKKHPEYHQVGFVVALANANLNKFPEFFELFYRSYIYLPEHYLAYKGKAALHAQLYALSRKPTDREMHRNLIMTNIQKAIEKYPNDTSLYKMLMVFSTPDHKVAVINMCIDQMLKNNSGISRTDIEFYSEQAIGLKQYESAQRFINKCKEWYPNSRLVQDAQNYLNEKKQ